MPKKKDISNLKFGKLTALKYTHSNKKRTSCWDFKCDCGKIKNLSICNVIYGNTRSCGCLSKESSFKRRYKYGMYRCPERTSWQSMKQRCTNPNNNSYDNYGGRGIKVCDRWVDSFENFLEDMGRRPSKNHTLDRIDNEKDYGPENCQWATRKQQAINRRCNIIIEYDGKRKCAKEWSEITGISYASIIGRIKYGWNAEKMLTIPSRISNR